MAIEIGARTIDGVVYLDSSDVSAALRNRAAEIEAQALALGDDLTPEQYEVAVAYHSTAMELRQRADWVDVATIEHVTEQSSDSSLGNRE